jgi:S-DNA-T family DNA segregation ATPase FtsK/SpoIIIE
MGDMLYMPAGQRPNRVHAPFVKDSEVEKVVDFLKSQREPEYVESVTEGELSDKSGGSAVFDSGDFGAGSSDDDLYRQAVQIVQNDEKASTSYVQRRLRIGYNRAALIIERMEQEGIVTPADHSGRREVI